MTDATTGGAPGAPPPIPLVDLKAQHAALRPAIDRAIARVLDSAAFILGPEVRAFEDEMAAYLGVRHAVGLSSGTDALAASLRALGVGAGDEVILPSWTFIATANAVMLVGAKPVFADIDPATFLLDLESARERVTPATKAVIAVHLYGRTMDLRPLLELGRARGFALVEDACQAHGARLRSGLRAGAEGALGCFSFYPSKNLGGIGDGGLAVTADDGLAEELRRLRNHGQLRRYEHAAVGYNLRLDDIQAAVLRVKLPHLEGWNARRRQLAEEYRAALVGLPLTLPADAPHDDHVYHVFVVRAPRRDALAAHLEQARIGTVIHYPAAIHEQPAYRDLAPKRGSLPHAEAAGAEVLSLPFYPELTSEQVRRVAEAIRAFYEKRAG